jgi:acetyl-CoA acetyltransferase
MSTSGAPTRPGRTTATSPGCRCSSPVSLSRSLGLPSTACAALGLTPSPKPRAVMLGEADVYVGGGVESMSRAPWAVPKAERAFPTGNTTIYDTTLGWRFVNPQMEEMSHTDSLGMTAENLAKERYLLTPDEDAPDEVAFAYDVSREAQDRFALCSHEKAVARRSCP